MSFKASIKQAILDLNTRLFYRRKLVAGIHAILDASQAELQDAGFLRQIIRNIGLTHDGRRLYGADNRYMNRFGQGLWQIPRQLAGTLVLLSRQEIRSALEIGTYQGWTTSVIAAYLGRFHPDFHMLTVDIEPRFSMLAEMSRLLPLEYRTIRSPDELAAESPDLCFIDGDHTYPGVRRDYELVGRRSRVCMFHDINDKFVGPESVPRLWREIRAEEQETAAFHEFTHHSANDRVMGIGIRIMPPDAEAPAAPDS